MTNERLDHTIVGQLQGVAYDLLLKHSTAIRAIGVFVDYHWTNQSGSDIRRAVWVGGEGPVTDLPTAIGSEQAAMFLLSHIRQRIQDIRQNMGQELRTFLQEVQELEQRRDNLKTEIATMKTLTENTEIPSKTNLKQPLRLTPVNSSMPASPCEPHVTDPTHCSQSQAKESS